MLEHGLPLLVAIAVWWLGTGLTLLVCALPPRTFARSLAATSILVAASLIGIVDSAARTDTMAAYIGFLGAVGMWVPIEMSFLMGLVTGPRSAPCPPEAAGWTRFRLALATLLHHELTILIALATIALVTLDAPNHTALATFAVLAVMRMSSKLNLFLGVPNFSDAFLPARLSYLKSYFRRRDFNLLLPISIVGGIAGVAALADRAATSTGADAAGAMLVAALLGLAVLEHLFMLMPLPDAALWTWLMPKNAAKESR